jgi:hypothetical protein
LVPTASGCLLELPAGTRIGWTARERYCSALLWTARERYYSALVADGHVSRAMMEKLKASVEGLYLVFKPYRRAEMDDYCPRCVNEREYARLVEPELEDVGHEALEHYVYNALSCWGDVDGFKRFLPRIYEALAFERPQVFELGLWEPVVLLREANWEAWPLAERQRVDQFLRALWIDVLGGEPAHPDSRVANDARYIFDGLATVYTDVTFFLDEWSNAAGTTLGAAERLAQFVRYNRDFFQGEDSLGVCDWTPGAAEQVEEWLRDFWLVEALVHYSTGFERTPMGRCLEEAIDLLADYQGLES